MPRVNIKLQAVKDSSAFDIGIFDKSAREQETWECEMNCEGMKLGVEKKEHEIDVQLSLQSLVIKDSSNQRFPHIADSNQGETSEALIQIDVAKKSIESSSFSNIEMDVGIKFGRLRVNWHPKSINRLLRFFRYFKLIRDVTEFEKDKRDKQQEQVI
jgi:hypothetical protein